MDGWGKVKQSAQYAGVSPRTFRDWLREGLAHSRLPSGTILVHREAIDSFIQGYAVQDNEIDRAVNEISKQML